MLRQKRLWQTVSPMVSWPHQQMAGPEYMKPDSCSRSFECRHTKFVFPLCHKYLEHDSLRGHEQAILPKLQGCLRPCRPLCVDTSPFSPILVTTAAQIFYFAFLHPKAHLHLSARILIV